ncbi:hypothetical protein ACX0HA_08825 [Flavobacterium hauense]
MKKIVLSKTQKLQIANRNLTTFEEDFKGFELPRHETGVHKVTNIATAEGVTRAWVRWVPNTSGESPINWHPSRYAKGETYILDQYVKVVIEEVELLQRENIFYWKFTVSLAN